MASLAQIYDWFMTGKRPTQAQFWAAWGSSWNKGETIPQSAISNLTTVLNAKTENDQFNAHKVAGDAHADLFLGKEDKSQKGIAGGYVPLDAFSKIAHQFLSIVNNLTTGGTTSLLSAEQGVILQTQIDGINLLLTSNDINLDTVQEIVDAIKTVETSLSTILVNDLTTGGTTKALTAEMGKTLKGLIDGLTTAKFDIANISQDIETDKASTTKVASVKQLYDWAVSVFKSWFLAINTQAGITYTFAINDYKKRTVFTSANPVTATIPTNAIVAIPIGSELVCEVQVNGGVTISAPGVTLTGNNFSYAKGETFRLFKTGVDAWTVEGNLKSSTFEYVKNFYIDTINGNDTIGKEGDNTKPFKTIDACVSFFGDLTNTTVIHLMTTGTYYFNSTVSAVNISIVSNVKCTLSFVNNTNERPFTTGGSGVVQYFRILAPFLKLEYSSTIAQRIIANYMELDIDEFYNNFSNTLSPFQTDRFDIKINKITFNNNRLILSNTGSLPSKNTFKCPNIVVNKVNSLLIESVNVNAYTVADIRGVVSGIGSIKFSVFTGELHVGNVTTTGGNTTIGYGNMVCKTFFYNSKFSGTFIDIGSYLNTNHILTGSFQSTSAPLGGDLGDATGVLTFDNLTAKLDSNFNLGVQALTVKDSHLTTDGIPFGRRSGIEGKIIQFLGSNSIISASPTVIFGGNFTHNIDFYYPLKSNIPSLGTGTTAINKTPITYP